MPAQAVACKPEQAEANKAVLSAACKPVPEVAVCKLAPVAVACGEEHTVYLAAALAVRRRENNYTPC